MHPLIGGIVVLYSAIVLSTFSRLETSQTGVSTVTPIFRKDEIHSIASVVRPPERESKRRCLAPFSPIQRATLLPRPPKPDMT